MIDLLLCKRSQTTSLFLNGHALKIMPLDNLKRRATDLALKYNSDLDTLEFAC
jgi:hypothetical protein